MTDRNLSLKNSENLYFHIKQQEALTRAQVGKQACFCNLNTFALITCTLYFQSSVFQYLNLYRSCLLFIFKIGQGQQMVIISLNLVGPESPVLHTIFQGLRPFKYFEENFQRIITIQGHGEYLDHLTQIP